MRICIIVLLLMALSGCGVLKVRVAVLDPIVFEEARAAEVARVYLPIVLGETKDTLARRVRAIQDQHGLFDKFMGGLDRTEAKRQGDSPSATQTRLIADSLLRDRKATQEAEYEEFGRRLELLRSTVVELTSRVDRFTIFEEARSMAAAARTARLLEYSRVVEAIALYVKTDTNRWVTETQSLLGAAPAEMAAPEAAKVENAARALQPTVKAKPLAGSSFAHAVASAPESRWQKSFNDAVGRGVWGSVDIAIVLNSDDSLHFPGDYSVKGMTFNPSDAIAATGKILTQGLILVAQANGVPVTASTDPKSPGASLAASSSRLQQTKDALAQKEQQLAAYRDALQTIATGILAKEANLSSDDATVLQGAITGIEARYSAQKSRLTEGSNR